MHYFSRQQIKRIDTRFQVLKRCFLFKPFNETFWNVIFVHHLKIYEYIFMNILNFADCSSINIFSFQCGLFLISLGK